MRARNDRWFAPTALVLSLTACGGATPVVDPADASPGVDASVVVDAPPARPVDADAAASFDDAAPDGGDATVEPDAFGDPPPTTGSADIERWLAAGSYRRWNCEASRHAARPGSAHSANRICTNALLSDAVGEGEYPPGAAAVKELYNAAGALTGFAVSVRVRAGGGGSGWYWYERLAPGRVVADSTGDRGGARTICVACHQGAPRDQVFTVVR